MFINRVYRVGGGKNKELEAAVGESESAPIQGTCFRLRRLVGLWGNCISESNAPFWINNYTNSLRLQISFVVSFMSDSWNGK